MMNTGVNKDALIQLLQSENKNYRLMTVDMQQLITMLKEDIKTRDEQIAILKQLGENYKKMLEARRVEKIAHRIIYNNIKE